jgi:ubiquitin carboxyl-terminal hydrolase L5
VSYIPHKGSLYELDGLQPGPILIDKYEGETAWIDIAKREIQNRIEKYSEKEIRFNLLVVCEDLKIKSQREAEQLRI